eukprot:gene1213-biopygen12903
MKFLSKRFAAKIFKPLWRASGEPLASLWRACLTGEPWRAFGEGSGGVWRAFGEPGLASLWRALASLWRALASLWRAFGEPGLTGEPGAHRPAFGQPKRKARR